MSHESCFDQLSERKLWEKLFGARCKKRCWKPCLPAGGKRSFLSFWQTSITQIFLLANQHHSDLLTGKPASLGEKQHDQHQNQNPNIPHKIGSFWSVLWDWTDSESWMANIHHFFASKVPGLRSGRGTGVGGKWLLLTNTFFFMESLLIRFIAQIKHINQKMFLLCLLICLFKFPAWLFDFSPVCFFMCVLKWPA